AHRQRAQPDHGHQRVPQRGRTGPHHHRSGVPAARPPGPLRGGRLEVREGTASRRAGARQRAPNKRSPAARRAASFGGGHMFRTLRTVAIIAVLTAGAAFAQTVIGVSIPAATHGWTGGVNWWADQAKQRLEAAYPDLQIVINTAGSASEQANDIEDLIAINQIDALVILPFESDPLTEPVASVKDRGIFVTVVDRGLSREGIEDVYVAGNNTALGQVSAEYIIDRLGGQGKIVVLRGIPTTIDNERYDAFMELVEQTDIEVLDSQYANWNRDDGFEVMQDFLTRFPEIDAVWAQDDDIALGVIEALRQANREDELFV